MQTDVRVFKNGAKAALIMGLASMAFAPARSQPGVGEPCQSYVGRQVAPVSFGDVYSKLPRVPGKDAYENAAQFQARLAQANSAQPQAAVIVRKPWGRSAPYFRPESSELPITEFAFGQGLINFGTVLRMPIGRDTDAFASAIAFEVAARSVETSRYETTNGFGAKVMVERTIEDVDTIWERAGKRGEAAFVGVKAFRPVATLTLPADRARDIVEKGSAAFLLTPVAPFRAEGKDGIAPTFRSPREKVRRVSVMYADVHCAFVLDGLDKVVLALVVK